jgi:hypothetical protein
MLCERAGVSRKTGCKWVQRYEGAVLWRSSIDLARRCPIRTPCRSVIYCGTIDSQITAWRWFQVKMP